MIPITFLPLICYNLYCLGFVYFTKIEKKFVESTVDKGKS